VSLLQLEGLKGAFTKLYLGQVKVVIDIDGPACMEGLAIFGYYCTEHGVQRRATGRVEGCFAWGFHNIKAPAR
jgi:hypothetical protein